MKIDIHELLNKSEIVFRGEEVISLLEHNLSDQTHDYKVNVEGKVTKQGNRYLVQGTLSSTLKLLCDRCMKEVEYPIHTELYRVFSSDLNEQHQDEDVTPLTESSVDLSDAINEAIALEIPMKVLCKEDCKGICHACGQDLNVTSCTCEKADIDPRLEKLKNIFHPQSEE
ncbi:hypothetical protein CS063_07190 [Sporanaerobium hydrogeniformans]|uniref:Uncharacterized protein n=1 Tax=Sporanaerobium hydrogeniformans TaxID=3072179 RepID=A0AC61DE49_9FIRM|nr:DUF177 domain-containing protein [Sporanaerobium hydrogeniformans]PHV71108.1 hypothetical protein CS063_07190 [Sporanaerobium hydrogeniformans]